MFATLSITTLLIVIMLKVAHCYAECHFTENSYAVARLMLPNQDLIKNFALLGQLADKPFYLRAGACPRSFHCIY
jgi:hypothetical protein